MKTKEHKAFRDSVHGYIYVPIDYCENFIDTIYFQRLRNIEQTSIRPLYPSAHHDRFAHSLGVYFLADITFNNLYKNSDPEYFKDIDINNYKNAFCIAALMHDCGHAPFSHIYEKFYKSSVEQFLFELTNDTYQDDFISLYCDGSGPAYHEMFSAAVFLKYFKDVMKDKYPEIDPILISRMITGTVHWPAKNNKEQIENCLILLLNGPAIDVDKLDYIVRDTWASGVNNTMIDEQRLLSSVKIMNYNDKLVPVFEKSALSVINNVISGRNFLYKWLYSHHTVLYFNDLLDISIKKISKKVSKKGDDKELIENIFSSKVFDNQIIIDGMPFYMPCDGDMYYLLKKHINDSTMPEIEEIFTRKPNLIPLWKTHEEFEIIFEKYKDPKQRSNIRNNIQEYLKDIITDTELLKKVKVIYAKPKTIIIHENELYISLCGKAISYRHDTSSGKEENENISFFYVFIPRELKGKINDCIDKLQSVVLY